jgi:hypothetical protein
MSALLRLANSVACLVLAAGSLVSGAAMAQSAGAAVPASEWKSSATLYVYLPSIGGTTAFPPAGSGDPINIGVDQILDNLKMTFMGTLDVHNGRWGVFADVIYLDVGNAKTQSRDFTIGGVGLPVGTTASVDLDLKSTIWALAGEYRVAAGPALTMDVLAGARSIVLKERLSWSITGSLGSIAEANRSGTSEVKETLLDAIIGVKGRYVFTDSPQWSLPFYLDVGAGDSKSTWQAAAGVGYTYKWGDLSLLWRYIDYDMKSGKRIESANLSGPMIGATFRW